MAADQRPVQIVADYNLNSHRIYSNYVQVNISSIDCTLTFCEVIGPQSEDEAMKIQRSGVLPAPVKAVLVIPNQIVEGLIQALQVQRDRQAGMDKPPSGTSIQ
jgi:hypothetical protein